MRGAGTPTDTPQPTTVEPSHSFSLFLSAGAQEINYFNAFSLAARAGSKSDVF